MLFLADENFPLASVNILRGKGYDVVAVVELMPGAKDRQILEKSHKDSRIILTFDRDYGELIFRHKLPLPAGVIYLRFAPATPEEPAEFILKMLTNPEIILEGKFTVCRLDRIRQQTMPR
jgi:predicted nuclease of predicted toxin-antitoxin system